MKNKILGVVLIFLFSFTSVCFAEDKNNGEEYEDTKNNIDLYIDNQLSKINIDEIEKYVGYGLQGIEISHPSMKDEDYPLTQKYAKKFNLFKSGGSDFHDSRLTQMGDYGLNKQQFEELVNHMRKVKGL